MNLQFVKYFVYLEKYRNFTRAAHEANVVQSAFSNGIKKLETEIGTPLFNRLRSGVELTSKGHSLLPKAQQLLTMWEEFTNTPIVTSLNIGVLKGLNAEAIFPAMTAVKNHQRAYRVNLIEQEEHELMKALQAGELDCVLGSTPVISGGLYKVEKLYEEELQFVVSAGSGFAELNQLSFEVLRCAPFIMKQNWKFTDEVSKVLRKRNINLNVACSAATTHMVMNLVANGHGISLMPQGDAGRNDIVHLPIVDEVIKRNIYLVWKEDKKNDLLHTFINHLSFNQPMAAANLEMA